ncbi:MAG: ArsR family transcriptional regulator [Pyrinomonadaceae bacterium]
MNLTKLDTRFFESTRGQIVMLLRMSARTVNEIAERLKLTDNAIRAHLLTLERDGLVEQKGAIKGFRKPHYAYGLTDEARHLFPKPYAFVLNKLIGVLKGTLSRSAVFETLRRVGKDIADSSQSRNGADLDARLDETLKTLELLGGAAKVVRENGTVTIQSESCPFNEVVSEHPEVCKVAESMIEEIVGTRVKEACHRNGSPKCCFEIGLT